MTLKFLPLVFFAMSVLAKDAYLFTSFRGNGEDGVYLALSEDGYVWTALNNNKPWLKPGHPGMLMRDPCIARGPDGFYHMVWTSSWGKTNGQIQIGYARSRDLMEWSDQKLIRVMDQEPESVNAWAPELFWDRKQKHWNIFWATTIPGRFAATDHETERPDRNHRIYATTTRDFKTFSPSRLLFDPGFNVIDSTIFADRGRFVMVFKDERVKPVKKNLRLAFAKTPDGPWTGVTEPFTRDWVEGPSAVRIGGEWFVYFDFYRKPQHYEGMKSRDLKNWDDISRQLTFPADHRHGTVIAIPVDLARKLHRATR